MDGMNKFQTHSLQGFTKDVKNKFVQRYQQSSFY